MYCMHCGELIPDDAKFCTKCGSKIIAETSASTTSDQSTTESKKDISSLCSLALIFSFLIPALGLIMGIIDLAKDDPKYSHTGSTVAIILSIVMTFIYYAIVITCI